MLRIAFVLSPKLTIKSIVEFNSLYKMNFKSQSKLKPKYIKEEQLSSKFYEFISKI